MDSFTKKELKARYKNRKPEMGIVKIECKPTGKVYLGYLTDTKGMLNSLLARLNGNIYQGRKNKELQLDWNQYGEEQFDIQIIDIRNRDEKEELEKMDYIEELNMLLDDWKSQFENVQIFEGRKC